MKMKMLIRLNIIFAALALFISACTSPMDVDTPRDKKLIPGENYKISGKISEMSFEENGVLCKFNLGENTFQIDSTVNPPRIWMRIKLADSDNFNTTQSRISVKGIDIRLDSLDISSPYTFTGRKIGDNFAIMDIERGLNTSKDTSVYFGHDLNSAEVTFNYNKAKGELWAYTLSKVYENKIWLEYRDSTYTDFITVTRPDTTYDNSGKMIITLKTEKIAKEVTIKLEEEKMLKDSLFLTGKLKFKF